MTPTWAKPSSHHGHDRKLSNQSNNGIRSGKRRRPKRPRRTKRTAKRENGGDNTTTKATWRTPKYSQTKKCALTVQKSTSGSTRDTYVAFHEHANTWTAMKVGYKSAEMHLLDPIHPSFTRKAKTPSASTTMQHGSQPSA